MKTRYLILLISVLASSLHAQNSVWLPEGTALYYAYKSFFSWEQATFYTLEVMSATQTDSSEIRTLTGGCGSCGLLDPADGYLEGIERKVFYVTKDDSASYLLYDFGASPGDTVWHIGNILQGDPEYGYLIVDEVTEMEVFDTVLFSRSVGISSGEYQYDCDIIDEIGATAYFMPQYALADPSIGPLVAIRLPSKGFHCFDAKLCAMMLSNDDYALFPGLKDRFFEVPGFVSEWNFGSWL